jgi:hypothetical protein
MRHAKMALVAAFIAVGGSFAGAAGDGRMDGGALQKAVIGKTVNLMTPLGALPINYRGDGTMWGRAGTLAIYTGSERDRGRWWIMADKLCQRWTTWLGGKSYCFQLRQEGTTVHWTRSDGLSGTATIAGK